MRTCSSATARIGNGSGAQLDDVEGSNTTLALAAQHACGQVQ